jgi:phage terminase large subunit
LIKLNLHEEAFNPQFKYVWQSKADFLVLYGGGGSGKSESLMDKRLIRCMTEPGHRMVNLRQVGKTIRISQWLLLKDKIRRWECEKLWKFRDTEMIATFLPNKNDIMSIGIDDVEKMKSLVEPTDFHLEEATEVSKEDFLQLILRLRGYSPYYKQFGISFNPIDEFHWLREYFFTPAIEAQLNKTGIAESIQTVMIEGTPEIITTHILHSTWRDNVFLPRKDKAKYEMMQKIDKSYYDVYGLGLWGKVGNLVYPNGYIIISKEDYPKTYNEVIYGLDFGYTAPTSLSRYGLVYEDTEKGRKIKSYKEQLIYESGLSLKQLIERMKECEIKPSETIYADSQDPAKIDALNDAVDEKGGYMFSVVPADKDVKNGIDYVRSIERYSCPENTDANKEIVAYRWKLDARGKPIDGEPIKYNDHSQDEERYALYTNSQLQELQIAFI